MESSSLMSDIKNSYGNNLSKKEYVFNSLNTNVIMNFSLPSQENIMENQTLNKSIKISKKPLKNNEGVRSNINSSTNLSSSEKPISRCTCKNSNCLKFYCECFANGKYCDNNNCICLNCKNTQENEKLRIEKYKEIISRNPKAIQKIKSTKKSWTCKCRNSNCLKKYCDCFQNGRFCTSKCRCINCMNKNVGLKNNNEKKMKRIRGIKQDKMNKIIQRNIKRNSIIKNDENINNNENNQKEEINKNQNELKIPINFYTPIKERNNYDKTHFIYYEKEATTAALTVGKERKKLTENKNDNKRKDIYTKLLMDNI